MNNQDNLGRLGSITRINSNVFGMTVLLTALFAMSMVYTWVCNSTLVFVRLIAWLLEAVLLYMTFGDTEVAHKALFFDYLRPKLAPFWTTPLRGHSFSVFIAAKDSSKTL